MPRVIRTVVVFGDSLSDIGRKWVTKSGRMARLVNEMRVNASGRFSDCRNWTDFMYEEAGGVSLLGDDADSSYARSQQHMTISQASVVTPASGAPTWCYLNYAEGGACGDTPREKAPFLGTFKDQVDEFEEQFRRVRGLSDFLFIIWFGANDLYTANRPAAEMNVVANVVANTQRNRLRQIVQSVDANPVFLFVDLARPLTAVRYQLRLEGARAALTAAVRAQTKGGVEMIDVRRIQPLWRPAASVQRMLDANTRAAVGIANTHHIALEELRALENQVAQLRDLERGVNTYNTTLVSLALDHGDLMARMASCITEQTVESLVAGSRRLLNAGAAAQPAGHISASRYDQMVQQGYRTNITTIDQAHPTDQMYRLIWQEIRATILRANLTFGTLHGAPAASELSQRSGRVPQVADLLAARQRLRHVP